jgi:hypothetical protein
LNGRETAVAEQTRIGNNYQRPHGALDAQTPCERLLAKMRAEPLPKV